MSAPRSIPPGPEGSQRPRGAPDEDDVEEAGSRVMRFGTAVSAVVLSSIIATTPAAVRVAPQVTSSCSAISVWVSFLALAFVPLLVATVVVRHGLAALRLFDSKAVVGGVSVALVWGLTTFGLLAALGAFLRATTHHHGLAGVTFAGVGLVVAAIVAVFSMRLVEWARASSAPVRWTAVSSFGVAVGFGLAFFARVIGRSEPASALVVDVVAFAFAAAFGAGAFPYRSRPIAVLALAGPPLAAIVLVLGFGTLSHSPQLRAAVVEQAPVLAGAIAVTDALSPGRHPDESPAPAPPH